jgi:hypothetical protein
LVLTIFLSFALNGPVYNQHIELNAPVDQGLVYDLIVYGSDPEGIAAATVAGEKGLKVLLVDEKDQLGGLMTAGRLNFIDMNYDKNGLLLTQGIFKRFYDAAGGNAFEIEKAKEVFKTFLLDAQVDVELKAKLKGAIVIDGKITSIFVDKNGIEKQVFWKYFIDASPDGDLAALAGAEYSLFGEDIRKKDRLMGVTLVFELEQVNWPKVFSYLNLNRLSGRRAGDERQFYGANLNSAWGYSVEGYKYEPQDQNMRLRGFNAARQKDGGVLVNALIIFDVDPLDNESKERAFERGEKELEYIIPYINENFPGFERAVLKSVGEELYVRESRHFITEYILSIDDVLENRNFDDQIAVASYPVDVQPAAPGDYGNIVGNPDRYGIPYRSLLPINFNNLLLAGKHAGYSSLAAGSARVIPIGMVTGEAAALAVVTGIENNCDFREFIIRPEIIKELQRKITNNGGYIEAREIPNPLAAEYSYDEMKNLRRKALVSGGYHNEYYFNEIIDKWKFDQLFRGVLEYYGRENSFREIDLYPTFASIGELIFDIEKGRIPGEERDELLEFLFDTGISRKLEGKEWSYQEHPETGEIYIILSNYSDYLAEKE